jgi:hypothetical protein
VSKPLTLEFEMHVDRQKNGRKELVDGAATAPLPARVPRVAKLVALAHHFEALLRSGTFRDYAQIATVGDVTRARLSQIMSLLNLAPDVQEAILFLPRVERGRDPIILAHLIPIAKELDWKRQRRLWKSIC